jgi:hypothetical protein
MALKQYSFLGHGCETNNGASILKKQQLNSNKEKVFSVRSVPRCYNQDGLQQQVQCSVESQVVKRRLGCEMATSLGAIQLKVRL